MNNVRKIKVTSENGNHIHSFKIIKKTVNRFFYEVSVNIDRLEEFDHKNPSRKNVIQYNPYVHISCHSDNEKDCFNDSDRYIKNGHSTYFEPRLNIFAVLNKVTSDTKNITKKLQNVFLLPYEITSNNKKYGIHLYFLENELPIKAKSSKKDTYCMLLGFNHNGLPCRCV